MSSMATTQGREINHEGSMTTAFSLVQSIMIYGPSRAPTRPWSLHTHPSYFPVLDDRDDGLPELDSQGHLKL
jgi:hypothetical protein